MIDTSPPGSWRHALDPEGASCRACGQNICGCSDAAYQGIVPALATRPGHATAPTQSGAEGVAGRPLAAPSLLSGSPTNHDHGVARV